MTADEPSADDEPTVPTAAAWPDTADVEADLIRSAGDDVAVGPAPLVATGFRGWLRLIARITRACWWRLVGCLLVGVVLPVAAILLTSVVTGLASEVAAGAAVEQSVRVVISFGGTAVLAMVAAVATYAIATAVGAAVWTAAVQATGGTARVREAFGVGARRGLPIWGSLLLAAVAVPTGLRLAVLPGLYVAVVCGLALPVAVCERRGVIRRSWRLVHSAFWRTLGRLSLLYVAFVAYAGVVIAPLAGIERAADSTAARWVADGIVGLLATVVLLPGIAVLLVGLFATYAQLRARREAVTAAQLTPPA